MNEVFFFGLSRFWTGPEHNESNVKSDFTLSPGANVIKLFTAVSYDCS
jgi:hypothetical protein